MKNSGYSCPYCSSKLDVEDKIVVTARNSKGQRGLLFLSTTLGDYEVHKNDSFHLEKDELLELNCPVCQHELVDDSHPNLSKLIHTDENGEENSLLFSNVVGEQCTLLIKGEKQMTYGEQAVRFQDPEWYLQVD